jgi:hypothetical protein
MNLELNLSPVRLMLMCILGMVTACLPGMSQTRPAALAIGQHVISLGAPVQEVIKDLQKDYTVTPGANSTVRSWVVAKGKDKLLLGRIYAKDDTVVGIASLVLGRDFNSARDMFDALFDASSKLDANERNSCTVATSKEGYLSGLGKAGIRLSCGAHRVYLLRHESQTNDARVLVSYLVMEELGTTE